MENTYTLHLLSIAMTLFIIALILLIRYKWPGFIAKLNEAGIDPKIKTYQNDKQELSTALNIPHSKYLETKKRLPFQQRSDSNLVLDFFWQDHDLLWENRLN